MSDLTLLLAAVITGIFAVIVWRYIFGMPVIAGYGMGQRQGNSLKRLFEKEFERVPKPRKEIMHLCGHLNHQLWEQDKWRDWLRKAHDDCQITARILAGPNLDSKSEDFIRSLLDEGVIELKIRKRNEEKHWLIADGDWAHIEEQHIGPEIPAGLCVKHLFLGTKKGLYKRFDTLWDSATSVNLQNISEIFHPEMTKVIRSDNGNTTTTPTSSS